MSENDTPRLGLPLLQPAQAQKHVTVNEALTRLDALSHLVLERLEAITPPAAPAEGTCWAVGAGATGGWEGQEGRIAVATNGGWDFVTPRAGMRALVRSGAPVIHDGTGWRAGAVTMTPSGAGIAARSIEVSVVPEAGTRSPSGLFVPTGVLILGATARVTEALTGSLTNWSLGSGSAVGRYGTGLGKQAGSWARGILSQPMVAWEAESLDLIANGGQFAGGGRVTIVLHWLELGLPG